LIYITLFIYRLENYDIWTLVYVTLRACKKNALIWIIYVDFFNSLIHKNGNESEYFLCATIKYNINQMYDFILIFLVWKFVLLKNKKVGA
jgi:hypothetical protein